LFENLIFEFGSDFDIPDFEYFGASNLFSSDSFGLGT